MASICSTTGHSLALRHCYRMVAKQILTDAKRLDCAWHIAVCKLIKWQTSHEEIKLTEKHSRTQTLSESYWTYHSMMGKSWSCLMKKIRPVGSQKDVVKNWRHVEPSGNCSPDQLLFPPLSTLRLGLVAWLDLPRTSLWAAGSCWKIVWIHSVHDHRTDRQFEMNLLVRSD